MTIGNECQIDFRALLFNIRNDSDTLKSVKMRKTVLLLIVGILVLFSCSKDDFQYSFEIPSKLLVLIRENGKLVTQFRYDSLNRLIQADRYLPGDQGLRSQYFEYDSENRLIRLSNGEYTESYEYNRSGSLVKMILHFRSEKDGYEWDQKTCFNTAGAEFPKGSYFPVKGLSQVIYITNTTQEAILRSELSILFRQKIRA